MPLYIYTFLNQLSFSLLTLLTLNSYLFYILKYIYIIQII